MKSKLLTLYENYVSWSALLTIPVWVLGGSSLVMAANSGEVLLFVLLLWSVTFIMCASYIDTYSSNSKQDNKRKELWLSAYCTIGLIVIVVSCILTKWG